MKTSDSPVRLLFEEEDQYSNQTPFTITAQRLLNRIGIQVPHQERDEGTPPWMRRRADICTIGAKSSWRFGDNYCVHYEEYLQPISFQYCFKMAATIRGGHFEAILIRGWWKCVKVSPKDVTGLAAR